MRHTRKIAKDGKSIQIIINNKAVQCAWPRLKPQPACFPCTHTQHTHFCNQFSTGLQIYLLLECQDFRFIIFVAAIQRRFARAAAIRFQLFDRFLCRLK